LTDAFGARGRSLDHSAPFEYKARPPAWGMGFERALVWGVLPGAITWVGAAIIVASRPVPDPGTSACGSICRKAQIQP